MVKLNLDLAIAILVYIAIGWMLSTWIIWVTTLLFALFLTWLAFQKTRASYWSFAAPVAMMVGAMWVTHLLTH